MKNTVTYFSIRQNFPRVYHEKHGETMEKNMNMTERMSMQETENDIDVKVNYELEVNYEHMADCCITMNIKSKDAGDFRITGAE
mgnify:CR=1 FL=1